jgi:hypothetical protein
MERGEESLVIEGVVVGLSSVRMQTYTKGITCVHCLRVGGYFAVERDRHSQVRNKWHLNLYCKPKMDMEEILMTSDHIIAKSRGGSNNTIENRQCMCQPCNSLKGTCDTVQEGLIEKRRLYLEVRTRRLLKAQTALALCLKKAESGDNSEELTMYIERHRSSIRNLETKLGVKHGIDKSNAIEAITEVTASAGGLG